MVLNILSGLFLLILGQICKAEEFLDSQYAEELTLNPLPKNHLHVGFRFQINSSRFDESPSSTIISDTNIFPNSLLNLLKSTKTTALNLKFGSGYWNSESWGKLPSDGFASGGNGLEIYATISSRSQSDAFQQWILLTNSLSGLFCASLNFIDESITSFPRYSFHQSLDNSHDNLTENSSLYLFRAALPREPICTENLTPIIKMLPTKGNAGISSILDGHKLFDSKWVSTLLNIVKEYHTERSETNENASMADSSYRYNMQIDLNNVFDIQTSLDKIRNMLPKPMDGSELNCDFNKVYDVYNCFPKLNNDLNFDLSQIFGKKIKLDKKIGSSKICVNLKSDFNLKYKVIGEFSSFDSISKNYLFANFDLDQNNCYYLPNNPAKKEELTFKFNIINSSKSEDDHESQSENILISEGDKPDIYVSRSITGYELDKGGFRTVFKNPTDDELHLVYFETLPWYLRIYLSSMETNHVNVIKNVSYAPAIDRQRPAKLELLMTLPKNTTVTMHYKFDKSLLLYAEYPPDANHGFELEPAVITLIDKETKSPYYMLRTATLLVLLPTPDFSMPYNVIILTSTIMALIFGSVFNLLVKTIISEEDLEKILKKQGRGGLLDRVKKLLGK